MIEEQIKPGRRGFLLSWLSVGWLAFSGVAAGMSVGLIRFMYPNVLFEPPQVFRVGKPEEYAVGEVSSRWKDTHGVWIVRTDKEIYALLAKCTHLGCSPNWLSVDQKFKCPCHGSGFDISGVNFEGPAPRPLERCRISQAPDGDIIVDKTQVYLFEKGQWSNPNAFIAFRG